MAHSENDVAEREVRRIVIHGEVFAAADYRRAGGAYLALFMVNVSIAIAAPLLFGARDRPQSESLAILCTFGILATLANLVCVLWMPRSLPETSWVGRDGVAVLSVRKSSVFHAVPWETQRRWILSIALLGVGLWGLRLYCALAPEFMGGEDGFVGIVSGGIGLVCFAYYVRVASLTESAGLFIRSMRLCKAADRAEAMLWWTPVVFFVSMLFFYVCMGVSVAWPSQSWLVVVGTLLLPTSMLFGLYAIARYLMLLYVAHRRLLRAAREERVAMSKSDG